jgi:hypothetical protein
LVEAVILARLLSAASTPLLVASTAMGDGLLGEGVWLAGAWCWVVAAKRVERRRKT